MEARSPGKSSAPAGGPQAPLDGLLIIDMSRVLAGPYAAMMLADLGARVVKIERPDGGDDTRAWGPPFVGPDEKKESTYFLSTNRNKESVVLDLKDDDDKQILFELVGRADVLIENFRRGVMDRLGLGADHLKSLNPGLVTLSITGFGASGPDADRAGYDQILQGEGGLMSFTGPDAESPTKVGVPIADILAGMFGAYGALAALRERDRTGKGQVVETSLLAGQVAIQTFQGTRWLVAGEVPEPAGNHHPTVCPYGMFPAADGHFILAVGNDAIWARFAPLVGFDPVDARYATNGDRVAHRAELEAGLELAFAERTVEQWLDAFAEGGIPAGEVKTLDRVFDAEGQARAVGLVTTVDHHTLGAIELPGPPLAFSESPAIAHRAPPTFGQHDAELRDEFGAG